MRKQSPLFLMLFLLGSFFVKAQEIAHPTIASLNVSYAIDPVSEFVPDSVTRVRANVKIGLNNPAAVSNIHLKIKNKMDDALLYNITYAVTELPVSNDAGIVLYRKDENTIFIIAPDVITLTLYKYEVTTEDAEASISPVYSSIQ
jgi:hypothetical protein